tara:strand:- start:72 stop:398 length:327 start_codon:yes stop_codon:yes gene_type:complete
MGYNGNLELLNKVRRELGKEGMKELTYKMIDKVDEDGSPSSSIKRIKELINYYGDGDIGMYLRDRLDYNFNYRGSMDEIFEGDDKIKIEYGDLWIKNMMKHRKVWEVK